MYIMRQAEQLAAEFLQEKNAGSGYEVALFGDDEHRTERGEFFYFAWQGAKYIATGDDKHFLYGANHISVHRVTGECRFLSIHECLALGPLDRRE